MWEIAKGEGDSCGGGGGQRAGFDRALLTLELGRHRDSTSMLRMGKLRFREGRQVARVPHKGGAERDPGLSPLHQKRVSFSRTANLKSPSHRNAPMSGTRGGAPAPFDRGER